MIQNMMTRTRTKTDRKNNASGLSQPDLNDLKPDNGQGHVTINIYVHYIYIYIYI
jgi:hypothetical protein